MCSLENHELRDLENLQAEIPRFGDTVVENATGDIGKVTELDDVGRSVHVTFRNGTRQWFYLRDLTVV